MIFLNSANSAAALVFYQPGVCTHTDTEGKQRKARVRNILKNTIFNEHPVVIKAKVLPPPVAPLYLRTTNSSQVLAREREISTGRLYDWWRVCYVYACFKESDY